MDAETKRRYADYLRALAGSLVTATSKLEPLIQGASAARALDQIAGELDADAAIDASRSADIAQRCADIASEDCTDAGARIANEIGLAYKLEWAEPADADEDEDDDDNEDDDHDGPQTRAEAFDSGPQDDVNDPDIRDRDYPIDLGD